MPGFVPHLSNLELIRQAGIFYPRITDLTGKLCAKVIQILISNYFTSTYPINIQLQYRCQSLSITNLFAFAISIHD